MEGFFETVGWLGLFVLVVTGALAGLIASMLAGGRRKVAYVAIGVVGAVLTPFVLALLGVGVLAAGGLALILVAAAFGAVIVLVIAKMAFD